MPFIRFAYDIVWKNIVALLKKNKDIYVSHIEIS